MSDSFWTEIHDVKKSNIKNRPTSCFKMCHECGVWSGHEVTCSEVTVEAIADLLKFSRKNEQAMRDKAARWLNDLQIMTGKVAILKHENNKLRSENRRLKALKDLEKT